METVFHATLALDAHLVHDLLERTGIPSRIDGEYLQGAAGELPLGGLVTVRVAPEYSAEARKVIAEWEQTQPADPLPIPQHKGSWAPYTWVLGVVMGLVAAWVHYNTPITDQGLDYDGDGHYEERYFYAGQKIAAIDYDRDSDGHVDQRYEYDSHGEVAASLTDDDFDQRFETRTQFVRGQATVSETDFDGDGFFEEVARMHNGVVTEWEFMSPSSRAVLKRSHYRAGRLIASEFDADGDGRFERRVEYDEKGDPRH